MKTLTIGTRQPQNWKRRESKSPPLLGVYPKSKCQVPMVSVRILSLASISILFFYLTVTFLFVLEQLVRKLKEQTDQANHMMATKFIIIESIAFYTAMPQLIAQILHHDYLGTAIVVQGILQRVLKKLPEQAMWPLAWLLSSEDKERADIGANIFEGARENLLCSKRKQSQKSSKSHKQHAANILAEARNLFQFLKGLATYNKCPKTKSSIRMGSYRGEVPLYEFIPPVQAALSADITRVSGSGTSPKAFPPSVPRIWEFRSKVTVMYSKARPKKLTALVIPGSKIGMARRSRSGEMKPQDRLEYAGEIHFLVKQEQKGDLRKDARVQDLNNVINRLMKSSHKGESASRNRQLRLRTFAVTCLSESTGMLEWVPATASLRSLIQKTYNPQASAVSSRRRGMRIVNFGDSSMRVSYETKCQEQYFKYGKLSKAAANFEECFLKQYPPVFYWWFVQKFQDPHSWYEARTLFTLSAAIWSGVGHVIGLGDRHSENILLDTFNGECVHVDFDW